jgi:hypothetical protein
MIQRGDGSGFALETFVELGLGNFDGNQAIQAGVFGFVDITHSARTNGREDFVRAEFIAYRQGHRKGSVKFT